MNIKNFLFRISHWETWPYLVKYIPLSPFWFWYCLRARSLWFFTPSNPSLTFGGFEGESKKEMYDQLPPHSYPPTVYISHGVSFNEVVDVFNTANFNFPVAVKPIVGMMGFMFRRIHSFDELSAYHNKMPADYLIQEFVSYPLEVSVFYYRFPNQEHGTISGFIKKEYLEVVGDGKSTLWELILNYPRVRFRLEEMRSKHSDNLDTVLAPGEIYYLSYSLNLSRGGKLVSLESHKDENLLKVFDELSQYTGNFFYGRYDIKCASVEDLKQGKNFSILEYNGSGAEPHHVYGNGNTLLQAYRILLHHWKILYRISRYNNRQGIYYWSFRKGWTFLQNAKRHFRVLKQIDREFPVF